MIADSLEIPRQTVSDWIAGRVPRSSGGVEECGSCGHAPHDFGRLPLTYVYLLGLYLGDGSIATHHRGVYKLRLSLDPAYPRIIDEAGRAVSTVLPRNKVNERWHPGDAVEVYSYSKSWPCLFPQHGPGKKHNRRIVLTEWQVRLVRGAPEFLLRGLIHSDGCRFMNTGRGWRYPRYSFRNFSPDIRMIFTKACDLLGPRWTTSVNVVYVSRKADVDRMDQFVGPKA